MLSFDFRLMIARACDGHVSSLFLFREDEFSYVPESLLIYAIRVARFYHAIQFIPNPSDLVQFTAVQINSYSIMWLKTPIEFVQLEAVRGCGLTLQYLPNASEAVQLAAVKENGWAIQYVTNRPWSHELCLIAIRYKLPVVELILKKSPPDIEALVMKMIQSRPFSIQYMKRPTAAMKHLAVQTDATAIKFIKHPSEALQLLTVKSNCHNIALIKRPYKSVVDEALRYNKSCIQYIERPTLEQQQYAMYNYIECIRFIKHPHESLQCLAVKHEPWLLTRIKPYPCNKAQVLVASRGKSAVSFINALPTQAVCSEALWALIMTDVKSVVELSVYKRKLMTVEMQCYVVSRVGSLICYFEEPYHPSVQYAAIDQDPEAIYWIRKQRAPGIQRLGLMRQCKSRTFTSSRLSSGRGKLPLLRSAKRGKVRAQE